MDPRSATLFKWSSAMVILLIIVADALLVTQWAFVKALLGRALGVEIGLLIFLHFLAILLVVESLESKLDGSRWWGWYFRLSGGRVEEGSRGEVSLGRRLPAPVLRLAAFTLLFYVLETFVLPFLPVHLNIQAEVLIIALILAWHAMPTRSEDRSAAMTGVSRPD